MADYYPFMEPQYAKYPELLYTAGYTYYNFGDNNRSSPFECLSADPLTIPVKTYPGSPHTVASAVTGSSEKHISYGSLEPIESVLQELFQELQDSNYISENSVFSQLMVRRLSIGEKFNIFLPVPKITYDKLGKYYVDIQDYIGYNQAIIAEFLDMSVSTLSLRWSKSTDRKWPNREIHSLKKRLYLLEEDDPIATILLEQLEELTMAQPALILLKHIK